VKAKIFKRAGKRPEPLELRTRASLGEIDRVRRFLRQSLHGLAVSEEDAMKMELSLHEIFVNISLYAYPMGGGEMLLRIWRRDHRVFLEFRDRGVPFDPARKPHPDIEENIRLGKRGGLGVFLFKTLMDGYTYRREKGENILQVYKRI
jgi:anti-sigma regulatory factor (Ser/Thr protein kinase)